MARSLQSLRALVKAKVGSTVVYITPPEITKRETPCIVLERDRGAVRFADNAPYFNARGYSLTVISLESDSEILNQVETLAWCERNRHFISDNLHHDVYTIFH